MAADVKTVNEEWRRVGSCQLPIVALLSERVVKMETEEEKKKHAGSFSPLSCHLGFVEGFSLSHFPSVKE